MADGFDVRATHRYLRMSPQKVRLVLDQVRGEDVTEAIHILKFLNKAAADPVRKLIRSAMANAEQNYGLNENDLPSLRRRRTDAPLATIWSQATIQANPAQAISRHRNFTRT